MKQTLIDGAIIGYFLFNAFLCGMYYEDEINSKGHKKFKDLWEEYAAMMIIFFLGFVAWCWVLYIEPFCKWLVKNSINLLVHHLRIKFIRDFKCRIIKLHRVQVEFFKNRRPFKRIENKETIKYLRERFSELKLFFQKELPN